MEMNTESTSATEVNMYDTCRVCMHICGPEDNKKQHCSNANRKIQDNSSYTLRFYSVVILLLIVSAAVQIYISCNFEKRLGNVERRNYILQQQIARLKKRWVDTQRQRKTLDTDAEEKALVQTNSGDHSVSSQGASSTTPSTQSNVKSSLGTSETDMSYINSIFGGKRITRVKRKSPKPRNSKKKKKSLDYIHVTGYGGHAHYEKNTMFARMNLPVWLRGTNQPRFVALEQSGELTVKKTGVYLLYSQVTSKAGSYEVRLQSANTSETSTVVTCTGGRQSDEYATCSSTIVLKVERGDVLYMCSKSTSSVLLVPNATYFGIVRIG